MFTTLKMAAALYRTTLHGDEESLSSVTAFVLPEFARFQTCLYVLPSFLGSLKKTTKTPVAISGLRTKVFISGPR